MAQIVRTQSRASLFVAWPVPIIAVTVLAATALISARIWVAAAPVLAIVAVWLVGRVVDLVRRLPEIARAAIMGAITATLVIAACAFMAVFTLFPPAHKTEGPPETKTVAYHATGKLDGDNSISLREEIILETDATFPPAGWLHSSYVDGHPAYVRNRTVAPQTSSFLSSTLSFPLDIGESTVAGFSVREGSHIELTGPKGALASAYPAATTVTNDPRQSGREIITIPLDRHVDEVSLAVLTKPLRNPAGHTFYQVSTWQPLPWAMGVLAGFLTSLLSDKVMQMLGLAARKALRARRRTRSQPQQSAERHVA